MNIKSLKKIIKEELSNLKRNKSVNGCGKINEAEKMPGKCYARIDGESYFCGKNCNDVQGCTGIFNHPMTGDSGACECTSKNVGMVGGAPIRRN